MRTGVIGVFTIALLALFAYSCGDSDDCNGIICDPCEPDQECCAGHCQAVYEEPEFEDDPPVLIGRYCLDTPQQNCPVEQW